MIIENGASSFHTIYFYDENSETVTPSLATYSLINTDTNSYTITPTTITPTNARYSLTVSDSENRITNTGGFIEHRILKFSYVYATTKIGVTKQSYILEDIPITSNDILLLLGGWDTEYTDTSNYDITEDTVQAFLLQGLYRVAGYLKVNSPNQLDLRNSSLKEAVINWTAGLIWNWKYTVDTPDATALPYGNNLIKDTKLSLLDPYLETHPFAGGSAGITWTRDTKIGEWDETREFYSYREKGIQDLDETEYEDLKETEYEESRP